MKGPSTLVGLIVATFVATISLLSPLHQSEASETRKVVIEIRSFEFLPGRPVVKPGDVVVWVNKDVVPHTVSATDGSWDSGELASGATWEMVVQDELVESYFCQFHPTMTAELDLQSRSNADLDNDNERLDVATFRYSPAF